MKEMLAPVFLQALDAGLCLWFFDCFLNRFERVKRWHMVLYAACAGAICVRVQMMVPTMMLKLLSYLVCFFLCSLLYEEAFRYIWTYLVIYAGLRILIQIVLQLVLGNILEQNAEFFAAILSLAVQGLFVYYVYLFRKKGGRVSDLKLHFRMLALPGVSLIIFLLFLWRQSQKSRLDYEVSYFLIVFLVVINLLYYFLFEKAEMVYAMERREAEYERKNDICRENYYQQLERQQQEIRSLRHDMKNQLLGILGELKSNDPKRAEAELERMLLQVHQTETIFYTGNPGINAVLNFKSREMERKHIQFTFQVDIPDRLRMDAKDIGLLVGNMLDNAVEGCERCIGKRYIRLQAVYSHHTVVLVCENSTDGHVDGLKTRKKETELHGIGTRSMKQMVKDYGGNIDFVIYEQSFRVEVTLFGM